MVRTFMLFIAASLFAVAGFFAQIPAAQSAEQIAMPRFPDTFVPGERKQTAAFEFASFVPQGQNAGLWSERITIEVYRDMTGLPLDAVHRRAQGDMAGECASEPVGGPLQPGTVHGREAVFFTQGCGARTRDPGGLVRYVKAVQGIEALYVIAWEWQTQRFDGRTAAVTPDQQARAIDFLQSVAVCLPDESAACSGG